MSRLARGFDPLRWMIALPNYFPPRDNFGTNFRRFRRSIGASATMR
jgi:hypothetical protein